MVSKILVFLFIFSILNVIREGFKFYVGVKNEDYETTPLRRIGLGVSISYILTILITGFTL